CSGDAFYDALDLVRYRYAGNYNANDTVNAIFGNNNGAIFANDRIDGLARAIDQVQAPNLDDDPKHAWPGASSRQHFYSIHDFFNRTKLPSYTNFIDHL